MSYEKNILSIDSDDDNKDYLAFSEYLEDDTKRRKNITINEIENLGDLYLKEINIKKANQIIITNKLIPYILKHSKGKYDVDELKSYSFEDIKTIYNEIKIENRHIIVKIFEFLFNY